MSMEKLGAGHRCLVTGSTSEDRCDDLAEPLTAGVRAEGLAFDVWQAQAVEDGNGALGCLSISGSVGISDGRRRMRSSNRGTTGSTSRPA